MNLFSRFSPTKALMLVLGTIVVETFYVLWHTGSNPFVIATALISLALCTLALRGYRADSELNQKVIEQCRCMARGQLYQHLPAFSAIDAPHHQVHQNVHLAMKISDADLSRDLDTQQQIVDAMKRAEAGSHALIATLSTLVEEKKRLEMPAKTGESEINPS